MEILQLDGLEPIALSANVAKVVRLGMNLLGIEVPSRM